MAKLTLAGIRKRYGDQDVVRDFSLEVAEGELVSFLGPSGCGKSTTLRLIAGLLAPDAGEITIDGHVVSSAKRGVAVAPDKRDIGLVFQSYALWPHMTVARNVAYGLHARKAPKSEIAARTGQVLKTVRMDAYADRYPAELSGGQQQRVALARAIAYDPKVLLLDEPLSNLDAKLRDRMRIETRELQQRLGFTAIYVTHDQSEAMAISDRIVVMREGRIHQVGTPVEVYERPATSFVAEFIGASNMLRGTVEEAVERDGIAVVNIDGSRLRGRAVASLQPGQPVAICLRAESAVLQPPEDDAEARPEAGWQHGVVQTASYQGDCWHYFVKALGGVLQVRTSPRVRFQPGDAVRVVAPPEDCIVTPEADARVPDVDAVPERVR